MKKYFVHCLAKSTALLSTTSTSLWNLEGQQCNVGAYQHLFGIRLKRHRRGICQVLHEQIFCTAGALLLDYVLSLLVSPSGSRWLLYDSKWQRSSISIQVSTLLPTIQVGLGKSFATSTLQQGQPGVPLKCLFLAILIWCKIASSFSLQLLNVVVFFLENLRSIISTLKSVHGPIPKIFFGILQELKP